MKERFDLLLFNISLFLLSVLIASVHIYTTIRNKMELGDTKIRIRTEYMKFVIGMWILNAILGILKGYDDIQDYLLRKDLRDLKESIGAINLIVVSVLNIMTQYKIGKVRNNGINTVFQKYNWEELKCYSIKRNEITIYLNKKNLFSKKNKNIKWTVIESQVDEIKNILEQHLDII